MHQAAINHQLDLFSYAPPPAAALAANATPALIGRTLRANAWIPVAFVRSALTKPNSTILELELEWMQEADSGATLIYTFGAREVRRLFADEPATSQIRINDTPGDARAIVVEIRHRDRDPHARMVIRDDAWHTASAASRPSRQRGRMRQEAAALAERQKQAAARTVRVRVLEP